MAQSRKILSIDALRGFRNKERNDAMKKLISMALGSLVCAAAVADTVVYENNFARYGDLHKVVIGA